MLTDCAARELTYFVGLEWDDADQAILAPLVDAALVWADSNTLEALAGPIVEQLWGRELREDIEQALDAAAERDGHVRLFLDDAKADLAAGPEGSVLARAIVEQGGFDLAGDDLLPMHCLLCLEEGLAAKPPEERGRAALQVARLARRVLAVPPEEIRAAVADAAVGGLDVATILATDERRRTVRDWLGRLAELGARSIPTISEELGTAVQGSTREPAEDPIWCEAVRGITAGLDAEWN